MNYLIVGGFLGSGKTSFILDLARYMLEKRNIEKVVIIENEIGEVGVDDKVLRGEGYKVKDLFAGCVCCSLAGELISNVTQIRDELKPDWIINETTGVALPYLVADNLRDHMNIDPRCCCVVDAKRWKKLMSKKSVEELVHPQLEGAHVVVVNKCDLVDEETVEAVKQSVALLNKSAHVVASSAKTGINEEILKMVLGD